MLRLKNVSKYYYSKGVIATGFSRVNVDFELGEFVAIVGESGSGKSTLLNVISGLDSYEEGEMYINGEETSHYRDIDFEEYRKKYVSNIFQDFNLVNSYTVYQNIELVLLINGYKRKEIKNKVLDLIKEVGLTRYKRTKVSKLSGGQKQRVAIARALARETPIIVADEPTGNLDSKAAKSVINLLKEISKDKLVIIVTHNFSEVEDVATRVVKMHDGKIVSDKKVEETKKVDTVVLSENRKIGIFNMIRLGVRNTFNIFPKFLLIFIVFMFVATSLLSVYASLKKSEYEESKIGYNYFFNNTMDTRIVINKEDRSSISNDDFSNIEKIANVKYLVKNDIMLDENLWFESDDENYFSFNGNLSDISLFDGSLDVGRMPEAENEVVLLVDKYDYYFGDRVKDAITKTYYYNADKTSISIKVVGVKYRQDNDNLLYSVTFGGGVIYAKSELINKYMVLINRIHSDVSIDLNWKIHESNDIAGDNYDIRTSDRVPSGQIYVSEALNYTCDKYNCKNTSLNVLVNNLYYSDKVNLLITNVYNEKNVNSLLGINKDDMTYGSMFMNPGDYERLFNKDSYQASVIVDKVDNVDKVSSELEKLGFSALQIRHTLNNDAGEALKILKIIKLVVIIILVITLFFISYFVIKLILKSRNKYSSILRILGANFRHIKNILDIELFTNASVAYLAFLGIIMLVKYKVINNGMISNIVEYLQFRDYVLMYVILIAMSYLISSRYARKIFKNSAMETYREEV